jgi:orotidine-5'-phosphate decarboxylase
VLKVGLELFIKEGSSAVQLARSVGAQVFLDLKLHDIPATVERAVGSACSLGASFLTVHASGGARMIASAAERAQREGTGTKIIAVTVLTSLDASDLRALGLVAEPREQVLRLARLAIASGASGLVCAAAEAREVRDAVGCEPLVITPGIRSAATTDDQKRVSTPEKAIESGASIIVVGRPIRDSEDPATAARQFADAIKGAVDHCRSGA